MVPSRTRALLFVLFLFLAALSLRPKTELAAKIENLCEPARFLRLLAAPIGWLSAAEVHAAERALLSGEEARRAAARSVLAAAQSSAAPSERSLAQGRGILHAEVVDRIGDDPDRLIVHFAPGSGVRPGMPVVCGDYFVGRVVSVDDSGSGLGRVDLVTRKEFRVGAQVLHVQADATSPDSAAGKSAEPALLVVGGVLPRAKDGEVLLAGHCPSDPLVESGEVRVKELAHGKDDAFRALADGFLLGWLERARRGVLGVRPGLDFESGPSHVGILCPSEHAPAGLDIARDPFQDEHWSPARISLAGDSSFWRETRILSAGKPDAIADGAAIAFGASFLGCVEHAGTLTSRIQLLGDPGLEISAMASSGDPSAPVIPVGKLVSLGRKRSDGRLRLRWDPAVRAGEPNPPPDAESGPPREVTLYTASGRRSVPPGLCIGRTVLPRGRGPFVLEVRQEEPGLSLTRVNAWRELATPATFSTAEGGDRRP